jgi:hypothetical protein
MKILVVLPDVNYFLWQMLVQIYNFRKFGYEEDTIYVIGKHNLQKSDVLNRIITYGGLKCKFYVFNDEREYPKYSSSMRPHILAKFFEKYPEMSKETFFYVDPDVLFTKKLKFDEYLNDNIWYLSDTCSYIDSKYIKSKSNDLFIDMCKIVGIDSKIVEDNDKNAGGAQYLMKGINSEFWKKVEKDSEELYKYMIETSIKYSPEHPIQAWTADMWAVLWNAWYFGHDTKIIKKLDFSWATDSIKRWKSTYIYHNAGAVIDNGLYFLKTNYQKSPFNQELKCSDEYCSFNYVKEIKETEKSFSNILF